MGGGRGGEAGSWAPEAPPPQSGTWQLSSGRSLSTPHAPSWTPGTRAPVNLPTQERGLSRTLERPCVPAALRAAASERAGLSCGSGGNVEPHDSFRERTGQSRSRTCPRARPSPPAPRIRPGETPRYVRVKPRAPASPQPWKTQVEKPECRSADGQTGLQDVHSGAS